MKKPTPKPRNFDNLLKSSINAAESIETNEQDMSVINDYLAEHLKSFVLLGYDLKSESVVVISGKINQLGRPLIAIFTFLIKFIATDSLVAITNIFLSL